MEEGSSEAEWENGTELCLHLHQTASHRKMLFSFRAWKRSSAEVVQMSEWLFREWKTHGYRNRDPIGGPLVQVGVQRWRVREKGGEDLWRVAHTEGTHSDAGVGRDATSY